MMMMQIGMQMHSDESFIFTQLKRPLAADAQTKFCALNIAHQRP